MVLEGVEFLVHSCVMRHGSVYFRALLREARVRVQGTKFKIALLETEGVLSECAFRVALDFIYTGHACVDASSLMTVGQWTEGDGSEMTRLLDVLRAADFLSLDAMVGAYTQLFKQRLTPETVIDGLTSVCNIDGLHAARKVAIDYFVANVVSVQVRD